MLEAEQRNQELIRAVKQYQLANQGKVQHQSRVRGGLRVLALIGNRMAILGASLEARYGEKPDAQVNLGNQSNPEGCTS